MRHLNRRIFQSTMVLKRIVLVLPLLLLPGSFAQAQTTDLFPQVESPGIEATGDYCLWRFNKSFDGVLASEILSVYGCRNGETKRSSTEINFRVLSNGGPGCDEAVPGVPANLFLHASGLTIHRRGDGLAHFSGRVELKDGAAGPTLFRGTLELIARVGTHQALGEACNEVEHIEGWIVASGVDHLSIYTLRATIAGKANLPDGVAAQVPFNRITGVITQAP